jgi:hypothetical protein
MRRSRWALAVALMATGAFSGTSSAVAGGGLSLSISSPRIEGMPTTFTASGVAAGAVADGESADFLIGAVFPRNRSCPPGGDDSYGQVPGSVLRTIDAFPIGSFNVSTRIRPTGNDAMDLLAGDWRECVYLQDRVTNAVVAFAQEEFTTRKAHAGVHMAGLPRHIAFFYDSIGRPNATTTFVLRARSELGLRTVQVGIEKPGQRLPCTADMRTATAGDSQPYRVKPGATRTYRVRTDLVFPVGKAPYGKHVRVCAIVAYNNSTTGNAVLEAAAVSRLVIRR